MGKGGAKRGGRGGEKGGSGVAGEGLEEVLLTILLFPPFIFYGNGSVLLSAVLFVLCV